MVNGSSVEARLALASRELGRNGAVTSLLAAKRTMTLEPVQYATSKGTLAKPFETHSYPLILAYCAVLF